MAQESSNRVFDIPYGIVSASLTSTGVTVVATTGGNYHGFALLANTTTVTAILYDASVTTSGNIVDVVLARPGGTGWSEKYIPVNLKKGLTISITGTGGKGVVYFSPKG